jgi:hypothetical protein
VRRQPNFLEFLIKKMIDFGLLGVSMAICVFMLYEVRRVLCLAGHLQRHA